jgi:hypothetical protein
VEKSPCIVARAARRQCGRLRLQLKLVGLPLRRAEVRSVQPDRCCEEKDDRRQAHAYRDHLW